MFLKISGVVVRGTQGASGKKNCREFGGSIKAQKPFFVRAGVGLADFYEGTINISTAPRQFRILRPDFCIQGVQWDPGKAPENFSLVRCKVIAFDQSLAGFLYYPHPETKIGEFPGHAVMEILTSYVPGLQYGDGVVLEMNPAAIRIS